MRKDLEPISILIRGNEKNKNEIIYNNIVDKMDEMNLSKDDQVEYLKSKISILESETHNKLSLMISILVCLIILGVGIYFVAIDLYLFGALVAFLSVFVLMFKMYQSFKTSMNISKPDNYDKIEHLREILNMRLK
jgi:ABC-type multidrug transport system fused ATPase/permease subunit